MIFSKFGSQRESENLDIFLKQIGGIPLLTPEKERELAARARSGDETAIEKLALANLRFLVTVAKQYQGRGLPLSDLINEGYIGLHKAAARFDERRGFKFISYAVWWIRQKILAAIADKKELIRKPVSQQKKYSNIRKASRNIQQANHHEPTVQELADALGMDVNELIECQAEMSQETSLDKKATDDPKSDTLMNSFEDESQESPEEEYLRGLQKKQVEELIALLPSTTQKEIIRLSFGITKEGVDFSQADIGRQLGMTRENVRQHYEKAIRFLRGRIRRRDLVTNGDTAAKAKKDNGNRQSEKKAAALPEKAPVPSDCLSPVLLPKRNSSAELTTRERQEIEAIKENISRDFFPERFRQPLVRYFGFNGNEPCKLSDIDKDINKAYKLIEEGIQRISGGFNQKYWAIRVLLHRYRDLIR